MGKKSSTKPAQQVMGANLVNKNGAAASSNALGSVNFGSIVCHVCKVKRSTEFYSNRQLIKHQSSVHNPYVRGGRSHSDYATCKFCTPGQADTITCFYCTLTKPVDKFLKTQRSESKPRCKGCVQFCLDTERTEEPPELDDYGHDDHSDDEHINDKGQDIKDNKEKLQQEEEEDDDDQVDGGPSIPRKNAISLAQAMESMDLLCSSPDQSNIDDGWSTVASSSRKKQAPATPVPRTLLDNDVNEIDGGGEWETVRVAGKTNSAFHTATYASRAVSGMATPAASTAGYSTTTRTGTTGVSSPSTAVSYTSTGRVKWGKPAKVKPSDVVENVWESKAAKKNNWSSWGGQPKLVKTKVRRREDAEEEEVVEGYDEDED